MSHHYSGPDFGFPRGDPRLDLTDLYAFPKPGDASKSVLVMNVHPSAVVNPPGLTTTEPFAPEALYELKIDTNGDAVADIAYRVRFAISEDGSQTATLCRADGAQAAGMDDGGRLIVKSAPVSMGEEARVTEAGEYRFFAGWRSDPFFFDTQGALNNLQFTGNDFFADKNVCSIVLEVPNSELGRKPVDLWRAHWSRGSAVGFRRTAARCPRRPSFSLGRRGKPICRVSLRTTPASLPPSRMLWSTQVGMRRRRQGERHGHCCRTCCPMTPPAQHPSRAMAERSPTTLLMLSWPSSQTGR